MGKNVFNESAEENKGTEEIFDENLLDVSEHEVTPFDPAISQNLVEETCENEARVDQEVHKESDLDNVEIHVTNDQDPVNSSEQLITDIKDNQDLNQAQVYESKSASLLIDEENNAKNPVLDTSNTLNSSKDESKADLDDTDIEKKMEERLKKYGEQDLNYKLELQQLDDDINKQIEQQNTESQGLFG